MESPTPGPVKAGPERVSSDPEIVDARDERTVKFSCSSSVLVLGFFMFCSVFWAQNYFCVLFCSVLCSAEQNRTLLF